VRPNTVKRIVVIGAGIMGLDIAQIFAGSNYDVLIRDINDEVIQNAKFRLDKTLDKQISKGKLDQARKKSIIDKLTFTTDLNLAANADLVVEAAVENLEIKRKVFTQLDNICNMSTIFASNTSSISITAIAAATRRSDKFIGIHFFNPANVMKLVEIIRGANTSDDTFDTVFKLVKAIGKEPVSVHEAPGFVVNKILVPMINEACDIVDQGISSIEDVDKAMRLGANHPMGPLALGDLIGLDICLAAMDTLYSETHDSKYRASLLLRKMVRAGQLGRKTGKGFYDYPDSDA